MRSEESAMRTVTVKKQQLIDKLRENKEIHRREFTEAMVGYWITFEHGLKVIQEKVKKRDLAVDHSIPIEARPTSHEAEYDRAIKMLEWELSDEVTLSVNDFQCYVMDEWNWQRSFKSMHATYSNANY